MGYAHLDKVETYKIIEDTLTKSHLVCIHTRYFIHQIVSHYLILAFE